MSKKFICVLVAAIAVSAVAAAQPRAIGVRFGYGAEVSYQHNLGANFIEADLGWSGGGYAFVHAAYDFIIATPKWSVGEWNFYAGPSVGFSGRNQGFMVHVGGQVGLDYTFTFPLQLSLDLRPEIFSFGSGTYWFNGWYPNIGVRYRF